MERQLPIGSAFFLLLTGPIDPVAQALVEELVALGNRFGWIVSASDGVRMLIGRAPWGELDSRLAVEGVAAPPRDADAHSPSSPNVAAPSITDPDEIDLT